MTTIELTQKTLIVHVQGADKLWALKSQLEIPSEHIVRVEIDPTIGEQWFELWKGIRFPGTSIPSVIAAGSFYKHGEAVFWDVHHPEQAITLHLAHEHYQRLIIEVDDPMAAVAIIQQAISRVGVN